MIHIANYQPKRTGGGWSFARYFAQHIGHDDYEQSSIYFVPSVSMVTLKEVEKAKHDGKKIVIRIDNATRNSRNRGNGMGKMKSKVMLADKVVYQSKWAKNFLYPFLRADGEVILNGVDKRIYNENNRNAPDDSYLYARSSRDEGKQWVMAWYWFVNNPGMLEIVGKFSHENLEYGFDFYNNERFKFLGEQPSLVDSLKRNKYFLYTYLNDACSNTLLEAIASGCQIVDVFGMLKTGGAPEIMDCKDISIERCMNEYKELLETL